MRKWWLIWLLVSGSLAGSAQQTATVCTKMRSNQVVTNTNLILPQSIKLRSQNAAPVFVDTVGYNMYRLHLTNASTDSIEVCYTVLPDVFSKTYQKDSTRFYDSTALFSQIKGMSIKYQATRQQLFDMGQLTRSGQISRGFSAGNTQSLTVNSTLNLNIEGKLSDDLNIKATITDQDIPYQPEGNTQQLQDFDKVFVQFYNDKFSVAGGDVVMQNGSSRFLKYRKNVLGGIGEYMGKNSSTMVGASSAKGQFASVPINVQEAVYGPYAIPPPNGLGFVIIIAASEKVYLDGKLLTRGFENDYTIDYNQAELEFTSNIVLTQYSRVRVDYEYAVRTYSRSITSARQTQKLGNFTIGLEYYNEQDAKNKPLFRPLSDSDKQVLENAGDSLLQAIIPGETEVPYQENEILYVKTDTIVLGVTTTIFKRVTQPDPKVYKVQFTKVPSNGSYKIKEYVAQGRVYEWVGKGQGDYVPYILLAAPTKKQMIAINGSYQLGSTGKIYFESAFSQQDKNLFSELHADDNNGQAFVLGTSIDNKALGNSNYKVSAGIEGEYLTANFKAIDRFRKVEFDRNWGLINPGNTLGNNDLNIRSNVKLEKDAFNFIDYKLNYRTKEATINGYQHWLNVAKSIGKVRIKADALAMDGKTPVSKNSWRKFTGEVYFNGKVQPGYRFLTEHHLVTDLATDSLVASQNFYEDHQVFIRGELSKKSKFELLYSRRQDELPYLGALKKATFAETVTAKTNSQIGTNHQLKLALNYRKLQSEITQISGNENVSGRIDWNGVFLPKSIRSQLTYTIANARVPKREYVFIEVPTGEGTHTWRDENGDGIKDLEEFFEAFNYDEKRYIKLYVPSNEYADAYNNRLNYRLLLGFPVQWQTATGFKKMLSKLSNTTSWTSQYSTTENSLQARLIPFLGTLDTSKLLNANENFRTTFFIDKNNPAFGITIGAVSRNRKILYANGFEGRKDSEYNALIRWSIKREYQFELLGISAEHQSASDYLEGRNYQITEQRVGPKLAWQPKPTLRFTTGYSYGVSFESTSKELPVANQSILNEIASELRLGTASKFVFNANFKLTQLKFIGNEKSPIGYELLKGLRPGTNYSLTVSWQQRLVNGLQIQLYYQGRKPPNTPLIHSMRAGISALF